MKRQFSIIRLYKNLDMWKQKHHQQILYKHKIKFKYKKLMENYINLLIENANFRTEAKNNQHTE
jgi:hypothetical protein